MLKIEKTEVFGWEAAIRGMRNPMNSHDKSDSYWTYCVDCETGNEAKFEFFVGDNDLGLMTKLRNAGTDHRKFMRMLTVYADINAPLYWWKEFDTYKVGTVANSASTMHKIHSRPLTLLDFSTEQLEPEAKDVLMCVIDTLNTYREFYSDYRNKGDWYQMIQLLPTSYNQKRTVMLNYEVLANIYKSRKNHKLDEWHELCHWIEELPYSELITG
jgi:hypothetical protein